MVNKQFSKKTVIISTLIVLLIVVLLSFCYYNRSHYERVPVLNLDFNKRDEVQDIVHHIEGNIYSHLEWLNDITGFVLKLNGTGYVTIERQPSLDMTDAISVEAWVSPQNIVTTQADTVIVLRGGYIYGLTRDERLGNNATIHAYINSGGNSISAIAPGEWLHIVLTYNKNLPKDNMKLYINGTVRASKTYHHELILIPNAPLFIGGNGKQNFHGLIDDIKIYNTALSHRQIRMSYFKGPPSRKPDSFIHTKKAIFYIIGSAILLLLYVLLVLFAKRQIFSNAKFYISLVILYVVLFTLQINLYPGERYPNWDFFWVDVRIMGKLISLSHALTNFELPFIDPYTSFGWNLGGDHDSFWGILNLLILVFSPQTVIVLSQMVFLALGGIGAYLLLRRITDNDFISFLAALSYISVPFVISNFYYYSSGYVFYCIPLYLFLCHKVMEQTTIKRLLFFSMYSAFVIGSTDIYIFIVVPPVLFIYSFCIALYYYHMPLLLSVKKTFLFLLLFILAGAYYLYPLYNNLHLLSSELAHIKDALQIKYDNSSFSVFDFCTFFYHSMFTSLYKPIEGSGGVLYTPAYFYIAIIVGVILQKLVFKNDSKQRHIVMFILLSLALSMFIISLLFYLPFVPRENARGILRYHLCLLPFMTTLSGFTCFSAINTLNKSTQKICIYFLIIIVALGIDLLLFGANGNKFSVEPNLFEMSAVRNPIFTSSNLLNVHVIENMWLLLPWLNFAFLCFLAMACVFIRPDEKRSSRAIYAAFIIGAIVFPLLNISVYNELRLQQREWQLLTRSSYRMDSYIARKACIDKIIKRNDKNYRTLYAGAGHFDRVRGRDWKLIAETELHIQDKEKVLFSYREFDHPYVGIMFGALSGYYNRTNLFPPLAREVKNNINVLKLMGVRWVISSDVPIVHDELLYKGKCKSEVGPYGKFYSQPHEGGTLFVYEMRNPYKIAFLVDSYKEVDSRDYLNDLMVKRESPWSNNIVYLEKKPLLQDKQGEVVMKDVVLFNINSDATITKETYNSLNINVNAPRDKYLVLSYFYRPNWKAYIDSKEVPVYRAYGGFMCVRVPAGQHVIVFRYFFKEIYVGIIISALSFLLPFGIKKNLPSSK